MYKKYVHPCYDWYDKYYKQLDDNNFVSSQGDIVTMEQIAELVKHDQEKIDSGEYTDTLTDYGLLDSSEGEFVIKVYDQFESILKDIVSKKKDVLQLKRLTGVDFEI